MSVDLTGRTLLALPPALNSETAGPAQDGGAADDEQHALSVNVYCRRLGDDADAWDSQIVVEPGAVHQRLVRFENTGSTTLRNVMVVLNLRD